MFKPPNWTTVSTIASEKFDKISFSGASAIFRIWASASASASASARASTRASTRATINNINRTMSNEEFKKQLEIAKTIVEKWPKNMQNILDVYASPTVATPRKPIMK